VRIRRTEIAIIVRNKVPIAIMKARPGRAFHLRTKKIGIARIEATTVSNSKSITTFFFT